MHIGYISLDSMYYVTKHVFIQYLKLTVFAFTAKYIISIYTDRQIIIKTNNL